jgi:hypothetical protein
MMKKLVILPVSMALLIVTLSGCAFLGSILLSTALNTKGLTKEEVVRGFKEALGISAVNSILSGSAVNGFYGNPSIFIPVPPEVLLVKKTLELAGLSHVVTDFEMSMNRAAELATKRAQPILEKAINDLPITDVVNLLKGPENAATLYLKSKAEESIKKELTPIITSTMETAKVAEYWNPVKETYNKAANVTSSLKTIDLEGYVAQKTVDGIFVLMGQEEEKIRTDPEAWVTETLQKMFGEE